MNTKFIFSHETEYRGVNTAISASTDAQTIDEIIDQFSLFLRGCGFSFHEIIVETDPIGHPKDKSCKSPNLKSSRL